MTGSTYDAGCRPHDGRAARGLGSRPCGPGGHELASRRLASGARNPRLVLSIAALERTYLRLNAGNFCAQPALDAALTSCTARLRERGVEQTFTVADVPAHMTVLAAKRLTLLNLALGAAECTDLVAGLRPELRVCAVGKQLLFRLESLRTGVRLAFGAFWPPARAPARWSHGRARGDGGTKRV